MLCQSQNRFGHAADWADCCVARGLNAIIELKPLIIEIPRRRSIAKR